MQSYVYQLPFGQGKKWLTSGPAAWALGNWQLAGVLDLMTGMPFYIIGQRQQPEYAG